jgi:DNA polymerase bacteriophage-type
LNIYFDFESRSPSPIRWGLDNYMRDARALILAWAADDGPVQCWDFTKAPGDIPTTFKHPEVTLIAHNAQFDRRILERLFGCHIPLERFRCTQAQAYAHGLPGSLETLGEVLGIKLKKLTGDDGHKLMLFFCVPRSIMKSGTPLWNEPADHPEKWERFKAYAIRDVEALREVHRKLPTWNFQGVNLDTWFLDQRINERGMGFDVQLATAAVKLLEDAKFKQKRGTAFATGGAVGSVTQREKLLKWFNESGLEIASMKSSDVREALEYDSLDPAQRYLLELRLEGAKSSGAKYKRGIECLGADGRLRDTLMYCGANRTGRWAGRTFAPQNLPRPSGRWEEVDKADPWKPIEEIAVPAVLAGDVATLDKFGGVNSVCNDLVRSAIIAAPGNELVSADWANIESRFLAWCTENTWKLDYFRAVDNGDAPDSYKALWASMFGMKVEDVTKLMRQASKQVDLACGYLGGTGAMVTMALGNNVDLEQVMVGVWERVPEPIQKKAHKEWKRAWLAGEDFGLKPWVFKACSAIVKMYRAANAAVVDEGYRIGKVVSEAMRSPNTLYRACKCDIWYTGHALIIELPSKRRLFYWSPQMRDEQEVDVETGELTTREVFWYKASRGKQWNWVKGWPGLWIENICQAGCNDILRLGLLEVQKYAESDPRMAMWLGTLPANAAAPIVLHVHDEPTLELPRGMMSYGKLEWLLTDNLAAKYSWLKGLPLAASGWTGQRFRK